MAKKKVNDVMCKLQNNSGCTSGVYGVGFAGALVYYIQTATGFWNGALGVIKALVWPAMLVYKLLGN